MTTDQWPGLDVDDDPPTIPDDLAKAVRELIEAARYAEEVITNRRMALLAARNWLRTAARKAEETITAGNWRDRKEGSGNE